MRVTSRIKAWLNDDRGAALPLVAGMLVLLLGMAAFAVDLGWLYLNGGRLQRAADSAALAGVVFLPGDTGNVESSAIAGANSNGWDVGTVNGAPLIGGGPDELEWVPLADNRLEINLKAEVRTFFLAVLGFNSFDISRTATAEYVKPVPLGSPDPCFGIGDTAIEAGDCNPDEAQGYWAAISGRSTNKWNGDQFATSHWDDDSWNKEYVNTDYRPDGYYYGIEVPEPGVGNLRVYVYDAGFYDRPSFDVETGDNNQDTGGGADTHFQIYFADDTPLDPTDNPPVAGCGWDITSGSNAATYKNKWVQLCAGAAAPGIYVLRVWTTGDKGGTNQYGLLVHTQGNPNARVYGINDISIFTNEDDQLSNLHLAEVDPVHANKVLEIKLYDAGEDDGTAWMTVKDPDGNTATCDWESTDEQGNVTDSGSGNCRIRTSHNGSNEFNGELITAYIDIPADYSCTTDCWWKMLIDNDAPHDRTTWAARIIGNPVRLVPNS